MNVLQRDDWEELFAYEEYELSILGIGVLRSHGNGVA